MAKITLGADPELHVFNAKDLAGVPAWDLTKATKHSPPELLGGPFGVSVHADGAALEFNIIPCDPTHFTDAIVDAKSRISNWVQLKNKQYRWNLHAEANSYSKEALEHPLAKLIGCDPDFDAYSMNPNSPRQAPIFKAEHQEYKFFGGHLHVGYDKSKCPPWAAVRLMDLLIHGPLKDFEGKNIRQEYYGMPGIFRPKPYGLEYRSLSSFWMRDTAIIRRLALRTKTLFEAIEDKTDLIFEFFEQTDWKQVKEVVNSSKAADSFSYLQKQKAFMREFDPANNWGTH